MPYVLEKLAKGFPQVGVGAQGGVTFGTLAATIISSSELAVFLKASNEGMEILTDLWDSREGDWQYGTRHVGEFKIKDACVNLLAGTTAKWLIDSIPSAAIGGGFTRRVNFVYGKDRSCLLPFPVARSSSAMQKDLVEDLRHIASHVHGEFRLSKDAIDCLVKYYPTTEPEDFDDEATVSYKSSKLTHVLKVCMALRAAQDDSMVISLIDTKQAIALIDEVSSTISTIFRGVGDSNLAVATDKVLSFLEKSQAVTRQQLLASLWRHMSRDELNVVLATLVEGDVVLETHQGTLVIYMLNPAYSTKGVKVP